MSFESGGGGRYGGFGSDSLGGGGTGSYSGNYSNGTMFLNSPSRQILIKVTIDHVSGGSSSRGAGSSSFSDTRRGYEEYNAGDDEVTQSSSPARVSSGRNAVRKPSLPTPKPAPAPEPVADLLGGFDDDAFGAPAPAPGVPSANKALPSVGLDGMFPLQKPEKAYKSQYLDDDFTDFQAAPVAAAPISTGAAPQPATGAKKPNLMDMLTTTSAQTPVNVGYGQPQQQLAGYGMGGMGMGMGGTMGMGGGSMMGMNMGHRQTPSLSSNPSQFSSPIQPQQQPQQPNLFGGGSAPMRPTTTIGGSQTSMSTSSAKPPAAAQAKSANFDDLWSMSLGGGGSSSAKPSATTGKSIKDLEKEKAMAGIWGAQRKSVGAAAPIAFGGFGNAAPPPSSGGDDLLL